MSGLLVNDISNFTFQLGCLDCDWWYFHFHIGCLHQIIFSTVFDTSLDIKIFLPSFPLSCFSTLEELFLDHDKFPSCLTLKVSGILVNDISNFTFQLGCLDCDWWYLHFHFGCLDQIIFSTVFDTSLDIKIFLPSFPLSCFSTLDELFLDHDKFPLCLTLKDFSIIPLCLSLCFLPISTLMYGSYP